MTSCSNSHASTGLLGVVRPTFVYKQYQTEIAQLDNDLFGFRRKPFGTGGAPCYSYQDLPQEPAVDQAIQHNIDRIEHKQEGGLDKDGEDSGLVVWERRWDSSVLDVVHGGNTRRDGAKLYTGSQ